MQVDNEFLREHAGYTRWASDRILSKCRDLSAEELERDLGNSFGGVMATLRHTFGADCLWLERLRGNGEAGLECIPHAGSLDELSHAWAAVLDALVEIAGSCAPEATIRMRRLNGEYLEMPTWQVFMHVVNHATWHRGQVVTLLRQMGRAGISLDIAIYYREQSKAAAG